MRRETILVIRRNLFLLLVLQFSAVYCVNTNIFETGSMSSHMIVVILTPVFPIQLVIHFIYVVVHLCLLIRGPEISICL